MDCFEVLNNLLGNEEIIRNFTDTTEDALNVFLGNPFCLVTEFGLPFEAFCIRRGINDYSRRKILVDTFSMHLDEMYACIFSILHTNKQHGNTWMSFDLFMKKISRFFPKISRDEVLTYIHYFNRTKDSCQQIYLETDKIAFLQQYEEEKYVADKIMQSLKEEHSTTDDFVYVNDASLCDEQNAAVKVIMSKDLSILTGGPGTGKTYTINVLLREYERQYPDRTIALLAPTGKAAKRLAECTGKTSSTIHYLTYKERFSSEEKQKFDFFVVDESSMLDLDIFHQLLHYIDVEKILLVGDTDQLESVGCGNILGDLIDLDVPCAKLEINHRSSDIILRNAYEINQGKADLTWADNFKMICVDSSEMADKAVEEFDDHTMILSPFRYVAVKINQKIHFTRYQTACYEPGDKVIFLKNNRKAHYVNGDTGTVLRAETDYMDVELDDGQVVRVSDEMYEQVTFAYAITIHKSQGSEYDKVVILLPNGTSHLFSRNLLYTAVTRAKREVVIIGSKYELDKLIHTPPAHRNTFMSLLAA